MTSFIAQTDQQTRLMLPVPVLWALSKLILPAFHCLLIVHSGHRERHQELKHSVATNNCATQASAASWLALIKLYRDLKQQPHQLIIFS